METFAAFVAAASVFLIVGSAACALDGAGAAMLLVAAFMAYAAQMHEYSGSPVRRAKSP